MVHECSQIGIYMGVCTSPSFTVDGPCEDFFEQPYYEDMKEALRPGGIHIALGKVRGREIV